MREFIAVSAHDDFAEMVVQARGWEELGKVCFFRRILIAMACTIFLPGH